MHPIFASYFVSSFGSFATTLPFSHTQIGVPYLHGPHRRQSFLASLVIYDVWSWPALQQLWFRFGILMYGPMICQWLIHSARDIMPRPAYGASNPTKVVQYFREIRPLNPLNHRETTR